MKASLAIGFVGSLRTRVGPGNVITLGGDRAAAVFSTPSMINLMEFAAREALRPHLDEGEESVGIDVQIQHTAATPPRNEVIAEAVVAAIEKNVISFDVVARDPWGEIGRGTHRRAIINTDRFARRLAETKPDLPPASANLPTLETMNCVVTGSRLELTLNRPHKRNAFNQQMTQELSSLLDWLENFGGPIRSVIISGSGETFCSGDDVGDLPEDPQACRSLSLLRGETAWRITELPQVFVAAIDGTALGGGLVLAAACDFRLATHRAKFGLPEISLGWPPNYGMGIVQSLIGRGQTLELALSGKTISTVDALAMGLVSQAAAPDRILAESALLADRIASHSALALGHVKKLLSPRSSWSNHRACEAFVECLATETARVSKLRFTPGDK